MSYRFRNFILAATITLPCFAGATASAEETVLRAVSAFQLGTVFYKPFERFVEQVNENGKGIVRIEVIGGPDAMPPFEVGNALRGGIIDLANTTAVYHANLVPEGLAMTLTDLSMKDLRENGGYDLLDQIHRDKAKIHWLGRLTEHIKYHIYLSEAPDVVDFDGLKIRSAPTYQAFFSAIGITPVQTAPGEVFTALERGTIDGYAWPSIGVFDLGWQEKTGARIEPGFYQVETGAYFSEASWSKLTEAQQTFLTDQMIAFEAGADSNIAFADEELARQAEFGIKTYTLEGEARDSFIKQANDQGWKPVIEASPDLGPKLRELLVK